MESQRNLEVITNTNKLPPQIIKKKTTSIKNTFLSRGKTRTRHFHKVAISRHFFFVFFSFCSLRASSTRWPLNGHTASQDLFLSYLATPLEFSRTCGFSFSTLTYDNFSRIARGKSDRQLSFIVDYYAHNPKVIQIPIPVFFNCPLGSLVMKI